MQQEWITVKAINNNTHGLFNFPGSFVLGAYKRFNFNKSQHKSQQSTFDSTHA